MKAVGPDLISTLGEDKLLEGIPPEVRVRGLTLEERLRGLNLDTETLEKLIATYQRSRWSIELKTRGNVVMSKRRLLLINPWIYDFAAFNLWVEPIGLLSIGSIFRQHGYQLNFIDCLDRYNPDLLKLQGLTAAEGQRLWHREISSRAG